MASSRLTWVYGRTHRAQDVSNEAIDEYQSIIRDLYLDQNMTRGGVISHLKDSYGFTLSNNQFSKATKRWGFYKQPRQAQTLSQAPEPLGEVLDTMVDTLDATDEIEAGSGFMLESKVPKNIEDKSSCLGRETSDQRHQPIDPSGPPQKAGYKCERSPRKTRNRFQESSKMEIDNENFDTPISPNSHQQWEPCLKPTEVSDSTTSNMLDQRPLPNETISKRYNDEKLCAGYLACCYLFQGSIDCFDRIFRLHGTDIANQERIHRLLDIVRIAKSSAVGLCAIFLLRSWSHLLGAAVGDTKETTLLPDTFLQYRMFWCAYGARIYSHFNDHQNQTQRYLERFRETKDELIANPNISLDMWSILCLQQESGQDDIPDNLLDRLNIDDKDFVSLVETCLGLCKKWLELVVKGLLNYTRFKFDSLFLHKDEVAIPQEICRLMQKQSRLHTWQEAGFLFAFVWGNANKSSWFKRAEISGICPTYFLAIICRMIVNQTTILHPVLGQEFAIKDATEKSIGQLYLDTIDNFIITRLSPRDIKREFLQHLSKHQKGSDLEIEDNGAIKRVQGYQKRALDHVIQRMKPYTSSQETPQVAPLNTDVWMASSDGLSSNKSTVSTWRSTSSSQARQLYLSSLNCNPTMTRSLASGSSRGSSLNSLRRFQMASTAITMRLKERQGSHMESLDEQGIGAWAGNQYLI